MQSIKPLVLACALAAGVPVMAAAATEGQR
jgi:hypothetical protein